MKEFLQRWLIDSPWGKLLLIALGIVLVRVINRVVKARMIARIPDKDSRYKTGKLFDFLGYLAVIVLVTVVFSNRLGNLTVALGVAGAGIAFALQEIIASAAGWIAISLGGFYKPGDRVQLGGIKGDVMDIGVLRTTIMEIGEWVDGDLYSGRIVLVANSFVFKEPVFNYSGQFPFLWDELKVPIQYGSDYTLVFEMLEKAGRETAGDLTERTREGWDALQRKYMLEDAQTDPIVYMTLNENAAEFTLRYVVHFRRRRAIKSAIFTRVLKDIEASGGSIKIATTSIRITEMPSFRGTA